MQRIDRQPAFVLHRRAYRESSLLLDLLTRDFGRVGAARRAVRAARAAVRALAVSRSVRCWCHGRGEAS